MAAAVRRHAIAATGTFVIEVTMLFGGLTLAGDYAGNRDAGIAFRFRFCSDGNYFYSVLQPGRWRLAHRGRFQIGSVRDPKYGDRTLNIIRFEPQHIDVPLRDRLAFALLEERALLADRLEEYIVNRREYDDGWRAGVKRVSYNFVRPDPKNRIYSTDWSIDPEN
jgi:hypothetical protein